jgi:hypothetical protein
LESTVSEDVVLQHCIFVLRFASGKSRKKIVSELTWHEALQYIGLSKISSQFEITIGGLGAELDFSGWVSIDDENAHLTFIRDI